jgi:hypothetical protein
MAVSTPLEGNETGHTARHCKCLKVMVLGSHNAEAVNKAIEQSVDFWAVGFSGQSKSDSDFSEYVDTDNSTKSSKQT